MNPIEQALRLMDTDQAFLGVGLAALAVVVAVVAAVRRSIEDGFRWIPAVLIMGAGFLAGAVIVETSYYSWYRHRCVLHSSDIDECFDADGKRLHDEGY
ncbi:MAG TPA: hypothetical protein VJS45_14305 [Acidimicrobiia bacterium]|nr:hypothetical protein [Acidimicrobiia bacterium]